MSLVGCPGAGTVTPITNTITPTMTERARAAWTTGLHVGRGAHDVSEALHPLQALRQALAAEVEDDLAHRIRVLGVDGDGEDDVVRDHHGAEAERLSPLDERLERLGGCRPTTGGEVEAVSHRPLTTLAFWRQLGKRPSARGVIYSAGALRDESRLLAGGRFSHAMPGRPCQMERDTAYRRLHVRRLARRLRAGQPGRSGSVRVSGQGPKRGAEWTRQGGMPRLGGEPDRGRSREAGRGGDADAGERNRRRARRRGGRGCAGGNVGRGRRRSDSRHRHRASRARRPCAAADGGAAPDGYSRP